jgi:Fe-Mn family superoxide dismutase
MIHQLPKLPFNDDALEPFISKKTIEFHYGKHHQAYLNNLNNLIPGTKFENLPLDEIVKESDNGIYNNSAQVWNHTFYFMALSPKPAKEPKGLLAEAINNDFGSFEQFKERFSAQALALFGSGWLWLVRTHDKRLNIIPESNAGNPIRINLKPILTIDVWEHAYYLDYQNRRADYLKNLWNIIDWSVVEKRFEE